MIEITTIANTLDDIQTLQREIETTGCNDWFVKELLNFSTIVFFQYLSHAVLEGAQDYDLSKVYGSKKYYELWAREGVLSEFIRVTNIGQFVFIWNVYEKYLRRKYLHDLGLMQFKISYLFNDLISRLNPANPGQMHEEFEVMRNTRNSLHDGGIYNAAFSPFTGRLSEHIYTFSPGDPVVPLRVVDVIQTIWSHYKAFEKSSP